MSRHVARSCRHGYLLTRLTRLKTNETAELLGRGPTALTVARQRFEKRLAQDEQWAPRLKRAESQARNLVAVGEERGAQAKEAASPVYRCATNEPGESSFIPRCPRSVNFF
ncbi:MAG: hypothetical protein ACE15E_13585 [Acidobacteriota bacterium]